MAAKEEAGAEEESENRVEAAITQIKRGKAVVPGDIVLMYGKCLSELELNIKH